MTVQIRLTWKGDVPGLADHKLSLAFFGDAVSKLLPAVRASFERELLERRPNALIPKSTLREIDLEIKEVFPGSFGLALDCVLPQDIELSTVISNEFIKRFFSDLTNEARGEQCNRHVANYLRALPHGVSEQVFEWSDSTTGECGEIRIEKVRLAPPPPPIPRIEIIEGLIVGVGFEPGPTVIHVKPSSKSEDSYGRTETIIASSSQVQAALFLQKRKILVAIVKREERPRPGKKRKSNKPSELKKHLVWLKAVDDSSLQPQDEERVHTNLVKHWQGVLDILGRSSGEPTKP